MAPAGSLNGDDFSSLRLPPSTSNALTVPKPASTTYSVLPDGSSRASNGLRSGGIVEHRAADQRQRAVRQNAVARDRRNGGVDREQELAVVGDFDPARRGLQVGKGRVADRLEHAVWRSRRRLTRCQRWHHHGRWTRTAPMDRLGGTHCRMGQRLEPQTANRALYSAGRHCRPGSCRSTRVPLRGRSDFCQWS